MQKIEKSLKNGIMTDWIIRCNKRGHYRNRKKKQYAGDFCKLRKAKTFYHRNKGQIDNVKYQQPATGQEVIFNGQGKIVTDIENIGTYNYFPVSESISDTTDLINAFLHIVFDVLPYYQWGNDKNDPIPTEDRMLGPEGGKWLRNHPVPENFFENLSKDLDEILKRLWNSPTYLFFPVLWVNW